ncbi:UNVERIFIED_CONTAM: hypothetical protein HDU68_006863 [Siphonaria sp. JEL0065]|nr:hypothetical protein HDU68_006863 [Siphonaria sp. JEL0065]
MTTPISPQHYVILGLLGGLTGEISISGIISCLVHHTQTKEAREEAGAKNWTAIIMLNFNIACIFYMFNIFFDLYLVESNCEIGQHIGNTSSHYFYLSFDFFILFKSYIVSNMNHWVLKSAILIYVNRLFWTVFDVVKSGGVWDPVSQNCNYVQNPVSGIGYNASDMIVDLFCTIVSITFTWRLRKSKITRIAEVILQENDTRCLNAELFWISIRKKSFLATTTVPLKVDGSDGTNNLDSYLKRQILESLASLGDHIGEGGAGYTAGQERKSEDGMTLINDVEKNWKGSGFVSVDEIASF